MADEDGGEDGDERILELSALKAIFPELRIENSHDTTKDEKKASLDIQVEPVEPIAIQTPPLADRITTELNSGNTRRDGDTRETHYISHLPHLTVQLSLPVNYPSDAPPTVHISTYCSWLKREQTQKLEGTVRTLWEDVGRDQVLYAYIDHLTEAADKSFGICNALEVSPEMKISLLDFDIEAKRAKFEKETFDCGVCLEPKKGSDCYRLLLCSHVFCVECLQDFYNNCITEGDVGSVKCLAPKCDGNSQTTKYNTSKEVPRHQDRTLEPSELLAIPLVQEVVQRYIKLKRKKQLESDRNTVYCPRQWCQGPARAKVNAQNLPINTNGMQNSPPTDFSKVEAKASPLPAPADRLAICEDCSFAFCIVCKASWHGEYYACFPRSQFEITAEERASEEYMKLHTQPCPTCDARAQKTHGCNHMICFKCDTHFCYLCGSYLDKNNPYTHFNNKASSCYMRLWELEAGDDGLFGHAFAGGQNPIPFIDSDEESGDEQVFAIDLPLPAAPAARFAEPARPPVNARRPAGHAQRERNGPGLRRFLEMVRNDIEDEWDSDEVSGDEIAELDE